MRRGTNTEQHQLERSKDHTNGNSKEGLRVPDIKRDEIDTSSMICEGTVGCRGWTWKGSDEASSSQHAAAIESVRQLGIQTYGRRV